MEKFAFHADCIDWEVSFFIAAIILLSLFIFRYFTEYKKNYSNLFTFLYNQKGGLNEVLQNILNVCSTICIIFCLFKIFFTCVYGIY